MRDDFGYFLGFMVLLLWSSWKKKKQQDQETRRKIEEYNKEWKAKQEGDKKR